MPSANLAKAARSVIESFAEANSSEISKTGTVLMSKMVEEEDHAAADVYRAVRDEAVHLLERQKIWESLDSDPYQAFGLHDAAEQETNGNDEANAAPVTSCSSRPTASPCSNNAASPSTGNVHTVTNDASDPQDNSEGPSYAAQLERIKKIMRVTDCHRVTTAEGYSSIRAQVELAKDDHMDDSAVQKCLRLSFAFERTPISSRNAAQLGIHQNAHHHKDEEAHRAGTTPSSSSTRKKTKPTSQNTAPTSPTQIEDDQTSDPRPSKRARNTTPPQSDSDRVQADLTREESPPTRHPEGTQITYSIDLSKDHGPKERLLSVVVYAAGDGPSIAPAEEIEPPRLPQDQTNGGGGGRRHLYGSGIGGEGGKDRYQVFIDPEALINFLIWARLDFDEYPSMVFLMSFPFYEHEWDLVSYLLDAAFGDEEEGDEDEDEDEEDVGRSSIVGKAA